MKKVIEELALTFKCSTAYAGTQRIMYVKGERNLEFARHVRQLYPALAFVVKAIDELPKVVVYSSSEVDTGIAANIVNKLSKVSGLVLQEGTGLLKPEPGSIERTEDIVRIVAEDSTIETFIKQPSLGIQLAEEVIAEDNARISKDKLRADVDAYLLANPVDKSQKGFFVPIADKFGCTSDYIRKRYNSLKERKLIEN